MAGIQLSSLELKDATAHVFRARNILTAKDALLKTELELVELLDMPFEEVQSALAVISAKVCPPCHSVFDILSERAKKEAAFGHLPTGLGALDEYLWGGIPFGVLTEIVGHAGIGKTQFCLTMSVLAALPEELGGLDGSVIYVDTEKKFRAGRLLQIAKSRFPEHFHNNGILEQLATRVLLVQPNTVAELMLRLQGLEESIRQHGVRLLVIDSVAALVQSEYGYDRIVQRQEILGKQASILKHLAEIHRMPVIVTNQVRFQGGPGGRETAFTSGRKEIVLTAEEAGREGIDLQLTAALGTKWAHAVNIRLVLESLSGKRYIKIAKSPMSATIAFHYEITAAGIQQMGDETFDASDGGRNMIQWTLIHAYRALPHANSRNSSEVQQKPSVRRRQVRFQPGLLKALTSGSIYCACSTCVMGEDSELRAPGGDLHSAFPSSQSSYRSSHQSSYQSQDFDEDEPDEYADEEEKFLLANTGYFETLALENVRRVQYPKLAQHNHVYMDYASLALSSRFQMEEHMRIVMAEGCMFGAKSTGAAEYAAMAQARLLKMLNTSSSEYSVVFTTGLKASYRMVANAYPFHKKSPLLLCQDNHNAVNQLIAAAVKVGGKPVLAPLEETDLSMSKATIMPLMKRHIFRPTGSLFVYPAQSSITGIRHSLSWIAKACKYGWHVLLDASTLLPTGTLDLMHHQPHFVLGSFQNIVGYPSGMGFLLVRRASFCVGHAPHSNSITLTPKASPPRSPDCFIVAEDDSLSKLSFAGLDLGLQHLQSVGLDVIHTRVKALATWMVHKLKGLRHIDPDDWSLVNVYTPYMAEDRSNIISFNILDNTGEVVLPTLVQRLAAKNHITLAVGSFNNPGVANLLGPATSRVKTAAVFEQVPKFQCVQVSLGVMSNFDDAYRVVDFISKFRNQDYVSMEALGFMEET